MNYLRCKCGKAEMWESGMEVRPWPCQGCPECKTTYASGPSHHETLQEHVWSEWSTTTTPGQPTVKMRYCTQCHKLEKIVEPVT